MTFTTWMILGLCTGFIPDDDELTFRLCEAEYESKHRNFEGDDGFGLFACVGKGLGRFYIADYIRKISGKHTIVVTCQTDMCIDHYPLNR